MSTLNKLVNDGYATRTDATLVTGGWRNGRWRTLAIATEELRAWDGGIGRVLVYSGVLDACSYLKIKVTGRKLRWFDYSRNLVTVQVTNEDETYRADVALPSYVTLSEAKEILEI